MEDSSVTPGKNLYFPLRNKQLKNQTDALLCLRLHRLCLSITDFHPDTWNPAWSVSTILTGLLSFMVEKGPTLGSIETSDYTVSTKRPRRAPAGDVI